MKNPLIVLTSFILLLGFVGCRKKGSTYPPTDGDFVKNRDGRGTAQVWGIAFDVADPVGSGSSSQFEGGLHSNPERTDARIKVTLGDDVNIRLEKGTGCVRQRHNETTRECQSLSSCIACDFCV